MMNLVLKLMNLARGVADEFHARAAVRGGPGDLLLAGTDAPGAPAPEEELRTGEK